MKKYDLSKIMKRAWEMVKTMGKAMSAALKAAWAEAKNPIPATVKMCVVGKETFTVDTRTGKVNGKTYNSRKFLKDNFNAIWDGAQWTVDVDKLASELTICANYYRKYIVTDVTVAVKAEKCVSFKKLVNRNDGFYTYVEYTDGSHQYVFAG